VEDSFFLTWLVASLLDSETRIEVMAGWRQAIELALSEKDVTALAAISRSRTEPASRVERARILLAYRENPSFFAVGQAMGMHHQTVQAASSEHWPMVRSQRSMIGRGRAGRRRLRPRPRHGW
jgi:hypothetical protein